MVASQLATLLVVGALLIALVGGMVTCFRTYAAAEPPDSTGDTPSQQKLEEKKEGERTNQDPEHDHSHLDLIDTEAEKIRDAIGRYDPDYWKSVDVMELLERKQVEFSPDAIWLPR